jgi:predicted acetyltransferase
MSSADVELVSVTAAQGTALGNLLQLYTYDYSELLGFDIGDDGLFPSTRPDEFWTDPRFRPFLVRAGGRLAGFAIVDSQSRLTGEALWDMSEFFVLRRHRRTGVGTRAAFALFDAFPGRWEVREVARNTPAQAFWRSVIGRYTSGRFQEVFFDDASRWRGPVQSFVAGPGARAPEKAIAPSGLESGKELALHLHRVVVELARAGDRARALAQLDAAFKADPGCVPVLRDIGVLSLEMNDLERAQKTFRALLLQRLDPSAGISKGEAFFHLGEISARQGDRAKALQMFERATESDPSLRERVASAIARLERD